MQRSRKDERVANKDKKSTKQKPKKTTRAGGKHSQSCHYNPCHGCECVHGGNVLCYV